MKRSAIVISCVLPLALLTGCVGEYVAKEGTSDAVYQANLKDAQTQNQEAASAAAEAKEAATAAARAEKLQKIQDYLAGDGASRPASVKAGLEAETVVLGMNQTEVLLAANAVGAKSVVTVYKDIYVTWEGVEAAGPALDAAKSSGHTGPLKIAFNGGRVARITGAEN